MKKFVAWVEIPATNIVRATKFYADVFALDLHIIECGNNEKMACFPSGEGAICTSPDLTPAAKGPLVSFDTGDDLEGAMSRVTRNKGQIVQPKTKIEAEDRGYFALMIDSEGNKVGLYGN